VKIHAHKGLWFYTSNFSEGDLLNTFLQVFARMTPYDMGKASCVCRKWRYTIRNPVFWRNACLKGWQVRSMEVLNMELLLLTSLISDYGAFL
jgi:hypothetical protein